MSRRSTAWVGLAALVLAAPMPARAQDGAAARAAFRAAFNPSEPEVALAALETYARSGDPDLAATLLAAQAKAERRRAELERLEDGMQKAVERKREAAKAEAIKLSELGIKALVHRLQGSGEEVDQDQIDRQKKRFERANAEAEAAEAELEHHVDQETAVERLIDAVGESLRQQVASAGDDEPAVGVVLAAVDDPKGVPRGRFLRWVGRAGHPRVVAALGRVVASKRPLTERLAAIDGLGRAGGGDATSVLAAALLAPEWELRAAAVSALERIGGDPAMSALAGALGTFEGRLVTDATEALKRLSGRDFKDNVALWQEWWRKKQAGEEMAGGDPGGSRSPTTFFGLETRSTAVIFVIDKSGSMTESMDTTTISSSGGLRITMAPAKGDRRIDRARHELERAITSLPEGAVFGLIAYGTEVDSWRDRMQRATSDNRKAAIAWAEALESGGETNIIGALESAFRLASRGAAAGAAAVTGDTIFLLTDGMPNAGRLVGGALIVRAIRRANLDRRIAIYTLGLGEQLNRRLLADLAGENAGRFEEVKR